MRKTDMRLLAVVASFVDRKSLTVSGRKKVLTRRGISRTVNKKIERNVNTRAGTSVNNRGRL